jgi:hypothetical protein
VPVTLLPPTTVDALSERRERVTAAVTVIVDCRLPPLSDAVIVAVPTAAALTVNEADVDPAWIATLGGTAATFGLLLDSATVIPPEGAAVVSVTVP